MPIPFELQGRRSAHSPCPSFHLDHICRIPTNHLRIATKAFKVTFAATSEHTVTAQGASLRAHMDMKEAYTRLSEFDSECPLPRGACPCQVMLYFALEDITSRVAHLSAPIQAVADSHLQSSSSPAAASMKSSNPNPSPSA